MRKRTRQYLGILTALTVYYLVHEGAHLLYALSIGVFKAVRFLGLGIQIDVNHLAMSDAQMALLCILGAAATAVAGCVLVLLRKSICRWESKLLRAMMYYTTVTMLLLDPLYLSVLCGFFGGGDMNGIALILPEPIARAAFGLMLLVNMGVFWKLVLPEYSRSFREN